MTLAQPWPVKLLVDHVVGEQGNTWGYSRQTLLVVVVIAGLLIFALNSLSDLLLTRAWVRMGQGMVWDLARDLSGRLQRRSLIFHSRNSVGDAMTRITGDSWSVNTLLDTLLCAPVTALAMLIAMLVVMCRMDVTLTLVSLGVAPFMAGAAWMLSGPVRSLAKARREVEGLLYGHVQQMLAGISVVQAFSQENREGERFNQINQNVIDLRRRSAWWTAMSELSSGLLTTLGLGTVLVLGGGRVVGGNLTVGELLVFLGYLTTLQSQFRTLAGIVPAGRAIGASVDRVMEVLEAPDDVPEAPNAVPLGRGIGHVVFERVSFGYEPSRAILHDISFEAQRGEVIAIIGATGAGKSTLVNLIPRLLDAWSGRVLIDGHDVRNLRLADVRRQVAMVLQDSVLFPVSIAENIAYGKPEASREEIVAAARMANADEFITQLENGYNTIVGERGGTLSGGERQRIAIARALLLDSPILILDEPTSNLDARTEVQILDGVDRLMNGRTTFIIAHRLSTIRYADQILLLEHGQVLERGSHETLLAHGGGYADLLAAHNRSTPRFHAEATQ